MQFTGKSKEGQPTICNGRVDSRVRNNGCLNTPESECRKITENIFS